MGAYKGTQLATVELVRSTMQTAITMAQFMGKGQSLRKNTPTYIQVATENMLGSLTDAYLNEKKILVDHHSNQGVKQIVKDFRDRRESRPESDETETLHDLDFDFGIRDVKRLDVDLVLAPLDGAEALRIGRSGSLSVGAAAYAGSLTWDPNAPDKCPDDDPHNSYFAIVIGNSACQLIADLGEGISGDDGRVGPDSESRDSALTEYDGQQARGNDGGEDELEEEDHSTPQNCESNDDMPRTPLWVVDDFPTDVTGECADDFNDFLASLTSIQNTLHRFDRKLHRPTLALTIEGLKQTVEVPREWAREAMVRRLGGSAVACALAALLGKVSISVFRTRLPQLLISCIAARGMGGALFATPIKNDTFQVKKWFRETDFVGADNAVMTSTSISEVCVQDRIRYGDSKRVTADTIITSLASGRYSRQEHTVDLRCASFRDKNGMIVQASDHLDRVSKEF